MSPTTALWSASVELVASAETEITTPLSSFADAVVESTNSIVETSTVEFYRTVETVLQLDPTLSPEDALSLLEASLCYEDTEVASCSVAYTTSDTTSTLQTLSRDASSRNTATSAAVSTTLSQTLSLGAATSPTYSLAAIQDLLATSSAVASVLKTTVLRLAAQLSASAVVGNAPSSSFASLLATSVGGRLSLPAQSLTVSSSFAYPPPPPPPSDASTDTLVTAVAVGVGALAFLVVVYLLNDPVRVEGFVSVLRTLLKRDADSSPPKVVVLSMSSEGGAKVALQQGKATGVTRPSNALVKASIPPIAAFAKLQQGETTGGSSDALVKASIPPIAAFAKNGTLADTMSTALSKRADVLSPVVLLGSSK